MRTMVSPAPILLSNSPALRLVCLARQFRPAHLATQPVLTPPLLAITGLCCGTRPLTRPRTVYTAPQLLPNLFTLAAEIGKLNTTEVEAYMKNTKLRSEALEWVEHAKALDTARKLLEHGVSWDIITSSTGLKTAELKKLAKPAPARKLAKK